MNERVNGKQFTKDVKELRKVVKQMLQRAGDNDVQKKIKDLSDEQFALLVDNTSFMNDAGARYKMAMSIDSSSPRGQSERYEEAGLRIHELSDWAGNVAESVVKRDAHGTNTGRVGGNMAGNIIAVERDKPIAGGLIRPLVTPKLSAPKLRTPKLRFPKLPPL